MLTDDEITAGLALCEAASVGPWERYKDPDYERDAVVRDGDGEELLEMDLSSNMIADADFIAAARTLLPAALDELRTLRDGNAALVELRATDVEHITRERDEARAEVERLRSKVRSALRSAERAESALAAINRGDTMTAQIVDAAARRKSTQEATAERIAAWLEKNAPYPPASTTAKTMRDLALVIRQGAWKEIP